MWLHSPRRSSELGRVKGHNGTEMLSHRSIRRLLMRPLCKSQLLLLICGTIFLFRGLHRSGPQERALGHSSWSAWTTERECNCTCIQPQTEFGSSSVSGRQESPVLTRDYYEPGFRIPGGHLCPDGGHGIQLMMMVQSRPGNAAIRRTLRRTWAQPAIQRPDVVLAFLVARTDNSSVQASIDLEADTFGDIVQANFVDHYNNLTLKSLATLEWADTFCTQAKFVFKADEDLFVNVDNLMEFIEYHQDERSIIYGNLVANPRPERDPKSVFYVSRAVWDQPMFPQYMGGPMYLISRDAVCGIFQSLMRRPYLFIEDVAITGIGAQEAGVRRRRAPEMYTYPVASDDTCRFRVLIGAHQIPTNDLDDIWRRVHDPEIPCWDYSPTLWKQCVSVEEQEPLKECVMALKPNIKNTRRVAKKRKYFYVKRRGNGRASAK